MPREQLVTASTPEQQRGEKYRAIDWGISRRLFGYMQRYPRLNLAILVYAVLLAAISAAAPAAATETIRWTIEKPGELAERFGLSRGAGLGIGAGVIVLLAATYYVVMGVRIVAINRMAENVVFDLRHDIFSKIQALEMSYFDRTKLGRILSRATGDVSAVRTAVAEVLPRTVIHGLMMVFSFAVMLVYDWVMALLIALVGVPLYFVNKAFRTRMGHAYRVVQESFSMLTANIAESVAGIRVTQAFVREKKNQEMFRDLCLAHRRNNMRAARVHGLYIPVFDVTAVVVSVLILVAGVWRIESGAMSYSDIIGFLLYTSPFFISIIIIAELHNTTQQAMAGGERIFRLLDRPVQITDRPDAVDLPRTGEGARIELKNVIFGYDPAVPVLHGISLEVRPGRTVALVGHTGSGKTSIVNLICRLYEFQAGEILIDGRDIRSITRASLHNQTGLVLQDNFLFHGTVMDNIRFGRPGASDEEVRAACESLDCLEVLESRLAHGLLTDVGERGSSLSAGQAQLVCFARAMLADPRILLLDEATSAVDTFTEHRIQRALEKLMAGRTCIVVAHRLSTVRRAHEIVLLEHGRIVERGTHEELLSHGGTYRDLYEEFVRVEKGGEGV